MTKPVAVGEWVKCLMNDLQGLVIHYDAFTGFFTMEGENGLQWCDKAEYLQVME